MKRMSMKKDNSGNKIQNMTMLNRKKLKKESSEQEKAGDVQF